LTPPPQTTAYFCAVRRPGTVLRVSTILTGVPRTRSTKRRVAVAVPDSSCRKFSAVRSPVSTLRAGPRTVATRWSARTAAPSSTSQRTCTCGSIFA